MSNATPHPEPAALEAFALGRLGGKEMKRVEAHLEGCERCGRLAREVPDDDLVALLRRGTSPAGNA